MGVRYEVAYAADVAVTLAPPGSEIGVDRIPGHALLFAAGQTLVVEGTLDELRALAVRALVKVGGTDSLVEAVGQAKAAAYGDSNDGEIELLQSALSVACELLGIDTDTIDAGPSKDGPINMDLIVKFLNRAGVDAYVEQTGGGCATILAGKKEADRWSVAGGPGWFEGPAWTKARASRDEFFVGPDDDGEDPAAAVAIDDQDEQQIAAMILDKLRAAGPTAG